MKDTLQLLLDEFHDELDRVLQLVQLVDRMREFASVPPPSSNGDLDFGETGRQLQGEVRRLSTDLLTVSGTLLLYAVGRFEGFVRRSFEDLSNSFAAKCKTFDQLPNKMRASLVAQTADALSCPSRYGFDALQVQTFIINLSNNMQAQNGLGQVNSSCLSITEQNMRASMLANLYKRLGIDSIWAETSKQAKMKMFFGTAVDNDVEKQAKALLDELINVRNQIAHPTSSPIFPDLTAMERYISFLHVLSDELIDVCRVQLHVFAPKP